jgi:hypothetical protein
MKIMQATRITYWISTGLLSFMMLFSGYAYLTQPQMVQAFVHMGFPAYFRIELAIAKIIGIAALVLPASDKVKEWAYAGFGITFISAFIAHSASGDPVSARIMPVIAFALLSVSYIMSDKKRKTVTKPSSLQTAAIL